MTNLFKKSKKVFSFVLAFAVVAMSLFTGLGFTADAASAYDSEVNCANRSTIYWDGAIADGIATGTGTKADPYIIKTADELAWLVKQNADITQGKYFEIDETIGTIVLQPESRAQAVMRQTNASSVRAYFEAIATSAKVWPNMGWEASCFAGDFDGNGATIYGLYQKSNNNAGLFSTVDAGAAFHNIALKNSYITSTATDYQVGAIAAVSSNSGYGVKANGAIWFDSCVVVNNYIHNASESHDRTGVVIGASSDIVYMDNCLVYGNNATYAANHVSTYTATEQDPEWKSHPEDYKLLAFTFDDGPSVNMPRYVNLFSSHEGTGTFFVRGISITGDSSYSSMQSAINAGWDIGNHGDKHLVATTGGAGGGEATYDQIKADINNLTNKLETHLTTRDGAPYKVNFYRPPNIKPTENTFKICNEENLAVIWLKHDALDWSSSKTYTERYNVFKNGIGTWKDGDVILCHEIGVVWAEDTYKILEELLPEFYEAGYRFCSISELMQMRGITQSQISGKLENTSNNNGMVTNVLDVARDKTAPVWSSANNSVIVSDGLVKPEGLEMIDDGAETPRYYNIIRNSIIFDTPVFDYAQIQGSRFNDTKCYENVFTNVDFEKYPLVDGKIFAPTEEQIKVIADFVDIELPAAFIKTDTYPELRSFHDAVFNNGQSVGTEGHYPACSCGLTDNDLQPHAFVSDDEVPEWDSYYCSGCGFVCDHWSAGYEEVEYEGDCVTAEGYEATCPACGYHEEYFEEIAGHNFTDVEAEVGADCQTPGTVAHKHCEVCDKDYAADASDTEPFENALTDLSGEVGACVEATDEEGNLIYGRDAENHWTVCALCGEAVTTTAHDLDEGPCEICGAVKIIATEFTIGDETGTGIYTIIPTGAPEDYDMATDVVVYDKSGNEVKYNEKLGGFPLVNGQSYLAVFAEELELDFDTVVNVTLIGTKLFPDTNAGDWYNDSVAYVVGAGIMSGYNNGKFGTSDSIQRQDFLVMLARLEGVDLAEYAEDSAFPDVVRNSYYEAAVNWGSENGIVTGYQNGKFGVGDKVTREQLVTFLYRYAKYKGYDYSYTSNRETVVSGQYNDYKNVSAFAKDAILWSIEKGVISGKTSTTIAPQGNAQRCEVAKIMYNIFLNDIF